MGSISGSDSRRRLVAWCAGACIAACAVDAVGSDDEAIRNAAREMGRLGVLLYQGGEWERARDLLHRAYELVPAPTIALHEARCLAKLGRLVEATERYEHVLQTRLDSDATDAFKEAVAQARGESAELRPKIATLRIVLEGAGKKTARVTMDGKPVATARLGVASPADPGPHRLTATAPGRDEAVAEVVLAEGQRSEVVLRLSTIGAGTDEPGRTSPWQSRAGWASLGVGVAAFAVGGVTGALMLSRKSELDDACVAGRCPPSAEADLDAFRTLRVVSAVGYGVGAVAAGAGLLLVITAPRRTPARAGASPFVDATSTGVAGVF